MRRIALIAAGALVAGATPAMAATFDIGVQGAPYSYATYNGGTSFTPFTFGCPARPDLQNCYQGPDGASASQVVFGPNSVGTLLAAHPGTVSNTAVLFTAPTSSLYNYNFNVALGDGSNPSTDGVTLAGYYGPLANAFPLGALSQPAGSPGSMANFVGSLFLNAGEMVGLVIGNNGTNSNDTVLLSGSVTGVPEPETWAMMILGFAVVGFSLRRKSAAKVRTRVSYAF